MPSRIRTILISAGALLAGVTLAVSLVARDEAPPDISDLPEMRPTIPESENAFVGLLSVAQTLAARAKTDEQLATALSDSTLARKRAPEQLAHARTATADLIAPWREALARPKSVAPANRDANSAPYEFGDVHRLSRLAALWTAPRPTDTTETIAQNFSDSLRAARQITESNDTLIVYLTGIAATNLALGELADFVETSPPAPALARQIIATLEISRLGREPLVAILHNEAHFTLFNAHTEDLEKFIEGMAVVGVPRPPAGAVFFCKPNQSARWSLEAIRSGLAQLDALPISTLVVPNPDRGPATFFFGLPHPDNAFGRHYAANQFVDFSFVMRLRPLLNARLSALQAYVALRAEQTARGGALPATLDELVPAYFPRVPVDAADGAPIRYSRELGAVWSVGATDYTPAAKPAAGPAIDYRLPRIDESATDRPISAEL